MKRRVAGPMSVLVLMFMVVVDVLATCGGGGGGGTGGMGGGAHGAKSSTRCRGRSSRRATPRARRSGRLLVPGVGERAQELEPAQLANAGPLRAAVRDDRRRRRARRRSGRSSPADEKLPVAVLAQSDGKIIGKAQGEDGKLKVDQVEKLLEAEMKQREAGVKAGDERRQGRGQEGRQGRGDRAVPRRARSEVPVPEAGEGRRATS